VQSGTFISKSQTRIAELNTVPGPQLWMLIIPFAH
jgi:hypothetical protein